MQVTYTYQWGKNSTQLLIIRKEGAVKQKQFYTFFQLAGLIKNQPPLGKNVTHQGNMCLIYKVNFTRSYRRENHTDAFEILSPDQKLRITNELAQDATWSKGGFKSGFFSAKFLVQNAAKALQTIPIKLKKYQKTYSSSIKGKKGLYRKWSFGMHE